jgi:hypothetical protein
LGGGEVVTVMMMMPSQIESSKRSFLIYVLFAEKWKW